MIVCMKRSYSNPLFYKINVGCICHERNNSNEISLYGTGIFNIANVVDIVETTGPLNISGEILSNCKILSALQTASQFLKILNVFPCYMTQQDTCKYTYAREQKHMLFILFIVTDSSTYTKEKYRRNRIYTSYQIGEQNGYN